MSKANILIVDDEEDILEMIEYNLVKEGYGVTRAQTGEKALRKLKDEPPDLVVLDLMLPGIDGLDVCRQIKSHPETAHLPVIMLTAKGTEADIVTGLEIGADDYVIKPFSMRVLLARIRAALRRKKAPGDENTPLDFGDLVIYPARHAVYVGVNDVQLTAREFRILMMLARRPGWVFSREQIMDSTQDSNVDYSSRAVDVHVMSLRRKLGPRGSHIETLRGVGYRFSDAVEE
ncbi:MAG TPA: response regulator transcription factor [bacterium]|jgi:two-component system phosphate regulon response regulator PhoB